MLKANYKEEESRGRFLLLKVHINSVREGPCEEPSESATIALETGPEYFARSEAND